MKKNAIFAYFGRFADYDTGPMVDEKALPDIRAGVNFNAGEETGYLRYQAGYKRNPDVIQGVNQAMDQNSLKAGIQNKFDILYGRVIAIDGPDIFNYCPKYHIY